MKVLWLLERALVAYGYGRQPRNSHWGVELVRTVSGANSMGRMIPTLLNTSLNGSAVALELGHGVNLTG